MKNCFFRNFSAIYRMYKTADQNYLADILSRLQVQTLF